MLKKFDIFNTYLRHGVFVTQLNLKFTLQKFRTIRIFLYYFHVTGVFEMAHRGNQQQHAELSNAGTRAIAYEVSCNDSF